jgi:hypothetical protein
MAVSSADFDLLGRNACGTAESGHPAIKRNAMRAAIKYVAPWLAAAAFGTAVALSPAASAAPGHTPVTQTPSVHGSTGPSAPAQPFQTGEDPLVPTGVDPYVPAYPGMGRPF